MNRAQRRQADKLAKRKPNRSRHQLNNMLMLEFETFETIERMFAQIRHGELNYSPTMGWVILRGNGQLTDIVYSMRWWLKQWATVAQRANITYDDTALAKLHKALEYHMPLTLAQVNNAYAVVQQQRHIYRTIDQQLLMRVVNDLQAEQVQTLPVPSVVVRGEIVESNLARITPQFDAYLGSVNTELSTDQDFADAEANAKNCREMAKRIEALQENIIGQMVTVNEANGILENYKKAFNAIGLRLEKAVKEQKEMLKTQAIMKAKIEYADFVTELNKGISVQLSQKLACPDFATEIKGVKTLETMQSRINSALANGKVEATTLANDVKSKLAYISESSKGYEHLVNFHAIVFSDIDYIKLHIQSVKDAEDVRRAKHEAAIKEQAEADARAKLEAEAKAQAQAAYKARQELEAQIIAEANAIPDGDAITNDTINESDFNKVFADAIKTGTGVMSVSVNEQSEVKANHIPAVQVGSVRPTAQTIINLVAKTYNVDTATANLWLAQSFGLQAA